MTPASEPHGILIVDKASGCTSHDVVGIARRVLGTRAIGHTGTLDPMATGVLVLVVGEATKLVSMLAAHDKEYRATIRLGASTRTLDADGEIVETADVPALELAQVAEIARRFVGEIEQQVPNVSAIKVAGKSLHKRARSGEVFDAPTRRVRLESIDVLAVREREIELSLCCGSGFYVRSLARDLANALGTLGHLTSLRRTRNGAFGLEEAVRFDELRAAKDEQALRPALAARVLPLARVCAALPNLVIDEQGVTHARHGRAIPAACAQVSASGAGTRVALDLHGTPIALIEPLLDDWRVLRGFRA